MSTNFLVCIYVREDGIVRYTFTQPKQILEMYRLLCSGKTFPYEALCRLFDEQTGNGSNMKHYNELLKNAVNAIVNTFKKKRYIICSPEKTPSCPTSSRRYQRQLILN